MVPLLYLCMGVVREGLNLNRSVASACVHAGFLSLEKLEPMIKLTTYAAIDLFWIVNVLHDTRVLLCPLWVEFGFRVSASFS